MTLDQVPFNLIEILVSVTLISSGVIAIVFATLGWKALFWPLLAALVVRVVVALAHRFFFIIPEGKADAVRFERTAWEWAQSGCGNMGDHLNLGASYVHSWIVGNVYACTDRAPFVFQTINVILGVLTVLLIARIAERLWDRHSGSRAAWVAAFFPMLIVYSAVQLREVWFTTFMLLGALFLVNWVQRGSVFYLLVAGASFFITAIFHGGAVFGLLAIAFVLAVWAGRELIRGAHTGRVKTPILLGALIIGSVGGIGVLLVDGLRFSSIGDPSRMMEQLDGLDERTARLAQGGAAYPSYMIPSSGLETVLLTIPRMGYLLIGPPPWDVRSPSHLIGMLDGLFYLAVVVLLWRYRACWWYREDFRILIFVLIGMTLVYGWGASNFGTGIRHRAKLVGLLIALSAGLLGRARWRRLRLEALPKKLSRSNIRLSAQRKQAAQMRPGSS